MRLAAGTRLGPYEVVSALGAGGMGEVYRARDWRLNREVAIKVLAADAIGKAAAFARFEQEARAAAALSDPHILPVFDIGHSDHGPFIVSELIEGETLRARIDRGPAPIRTALDIASQIARGLAAAHDKSIVHRDLKPENVLLTRDGIAKIADFGVAKLLEPTPSLVDAGIATRTPIHTEPGALVGTAGYMAPEQVRCESADHRADIFALGCVLYELVKGQRPFPGTSRVDVLYAILNRDPFDATSSGSSVMELDADRVIRRCLEKDPGRRFQSTRDLAFALETLASVGFRVQAGLPQPTSGIHRVIPWALAAVCSAALAWQLFAGPATWSTPLPLLEFEIGKLSSSPNPNQLALSPTGMHLVTVVAEAGGMLWLQPLDGSPGMSVRGTEGAQWPFWSPDGQSLAFFAGGKLKRIALQGGGPQTLADAPDGQGGSWGRDEVIIFAPDRANAPLLRVSSTGGQAVPLTTLDPGRREVAHLHPQIPPRQ